MLENGNTDSPLASNGIPWWKLERYPNSKRRFGAERRLAAYLWFNLEVDDLFTMRDLRHELGDGVVPDDSEHLNRRLRELRKDDWLLTSNQDDRSLPTDVYRLDAKGTKVWLGERNPRGTVSAKTARLIQARDGNRCTVCGIGSGELYHHEEVRAVMTVGHRIPQERGGNSDLDNLRTECTRCNEPMRDSSPDPETYSEVLTEVRGLKSRDLVTLRLWLQRGERTRSKLDLIYDRARQLSPGERSTLQKKLDQMLLPSTQK